MTQPNDRFPVPTAPDDDDSVDIRDFTVKHKRIRFRIENDVFEAHPVLGLPLMQQLSSLGRSIGDVARSADDESAVNEKLNVIYKVFDKLLLPDSATRFRALIDDNRIDTVRQLIPIIYFLLESYGSRPTQPSSDSSTGSPSGTGGTSSTDDASTEVFASQT